MVQLQHHHEPGLNLLEQGQRHGWPGQVLQLLQTLRSASVALGNSAVVAWAHTPSLLGHSSEQSPLGSETPSRPLVHSHYPEQAAQNGHSASEGMSRTAWILLIACIVLFLALSVMSWRYWRAYREASALKHPSVAGEPQLDTARTVPKRSVRRLPPTARKGSRNADEQLVPATASRQWQGSEPPPIFPQLILPNSESRFVLPHVQLQQVLASGQGVVEILSPKGTAILRAAINMVGANTNTRSLTISKVVRPDIPQLTLSPQRQGGSPTASTSQEQRELERLLEVYGDGGRRRYGLLQLDDEGAGLFCLGELVMSLEVINQGGILFEALSPAGNSLAFAGWNMDVGETAGGARAIDSLNLRVKPAVDALLVLACVLSKMFMEPPPTVPQQQ
mmetsp:Transcript_38161/g.89505  ORF Transcript_38161/g.89505 Transcript_38161/m.89505 type:complete len:392 (-) Transcript_38161:16-1191(-)